MDLSIAIGTDDGENVKKDDHFGQSQYFAIYKLAERSCDFVERRKNVLFKGDESMKHGDPEKAKATAAVLQGVDVIVGGRFGPNLPRLLKKFVCVLVDKDSLSEVIEVIKSNRENIIREKNKEEERKHLVLDR